MSITCPACGSANLDDAEFCDSCGYELVGAVAPSPKTSAVNQTLPANQFPPVNNFPVPVSQTLIPPISVLATTKVAKLISKQPGSPVPEFSLDTGSAVIGIFDSDSGPVDIDLESFPGGETVSRQHGEIYQEGGNWKIKDIGSTNGIFIKRAGEARYGARITMPEILNNGDEIAVAKVRFLFQTP